MSDLDRLKSLFVGLIRQAMSGVDYLALYPCKVLAQNGDGSLELQPDSTKIAGQSKVPLFIGVPGVTVQVTGGRVLLGFQSGDPSLPFAICFSQTTLTTITIKSTAQVTLDCPQIKLGMGSQPVARQGDTVLVVVRPGVVGGPHTGTIMMGAPGVVA